MYSIYLYIPAGELAGPRPAAAAAAERAREEERENTVNQTGQTGLKNK